MGTQAEDQSYASPTKDERTEEEKKIDAWLPVTSSRNAKWWYSAFHNVTAMVGAGVLSLPYAMSELGWGPGIAVLVISWVVTLYTLWQMVEMHEMVPGKRFDRYHELGQHAFGEKLGLWIVVPQQLVVEVGVNIVYMVTGGKSLKKFHDVICDGKCKNIKTTYFIMIFSSVHFVLSQLPNFNSISGISLAAAVMSLSYSTIAWGASVDKGRVENVHYSLRATTTTGKVFDFFSALGDVAFAYAGHNVVLEIQATIPSTPEKPSKKPMWKGCVVAYIVGKAMSMNRRAVKPKKFSSARQISSSRTVLAADSFSGQVIPESKFNLQQSGKVGFRLEDSGFCVDNSRPEEADAAQTTENSHDGTRLTFAANLESSGHSDLTFASSTSDQNKLRSQRRQNKKSSAGIPASNAKFVQSLPTSAINVAHTEVSASQPNTVLAAQWTEYSKAEPTTVTCTKTENFGYQEDCETWRIRGNQAYAAGQLTKAEEYYTHGINSVSPNEASRKALMLCYSNRAATRISLGRMRDALSDCRKATEIDSSFLKAQVRAANCLLALGDVEEAQKGFEICLKSNHAASLNHKIIEEASDGLQKAQKVSSFSLQSKEYLVKKEFDKIPSALQMITDALSISIHSDSLMKMKAEAMLLLRRYEEVIRFCGETLHLAERNSVSMCLDEHPENINLDSYSSSGKSWRYYLITKSYFFMGKLEEAHQFLKKHEQATLVEYKCGKQSQESLSSLSKTISELLHLKVAGNEAFQAGKYSEAVEHYTAALLSNTESLHFSAICFGNRAAAYQAMGHILDAIADCSLAIALDTSYCKVISRRASLYELIRDYSQAETDLRRLISLLEEQLQEHMSTPSEKLDNVRNNLHRANLRLSALVRDARKRNTLNIYLILGIEPSCSVADIKKAYRKAALRHHPDKAGNFLVRSENIDDTVWSEIANVIRRDADYLFKIIGKAYAILSDPTMKSK